MNFKILSFSVLFLVVFANPSTKAQQNQVNQDPVLKETNQKALKALSQEWQNEWEASYEKALKKARKHNWVIREEMKDGSVVELVGLGEDGEPIYYTTHNDDAAETISTDKVWPSASNNLNLDGSGETAGIWDGGKVRTTHQEFSGRVVQRDNSSNLDDHATHVAGTMVAQGVKSNAKGMAFNASLDAFDWLNDDTEMVNQAGSGLLISNHSYGELSGFRDADTAYLWYGNTNVSQTEDYQFGFYDNSAKNWDQIAKNAPYYLIVKSAGNDRNDDGPSSGNPHYFRDPNNSYKWTKSFNSRASDGNYDCLPPKSVAKNVLTVGAVKDIPGGYSAPSDVNMTSFSSWGPADDGRIKPDLVGNGRSLYSPSDGSDSDYENKSGTSMSAPNVSGSMVLLQSLYKSLNGGTPMLASTLKSLVIHTANEAGNNPGPDYKFGWGLMNTASAAAKIKQDASQNIIRELTLQNNNPITINVTADGNLPLKATIAWTDEAGNVPATSLDPSTKMLVNDLDLRINNNSGQTFKPWKLDPNNPSQAATTGDNNTDNVEEVLVQNPVPGKTYTIKIDHKGSLSGSSQDFGLVLSGVTSSSSTTTCSGTKTINKNAGFVSDGSGDKQYSNNLDCHWELTAPDGSPLNLDFTQFNTVDPGDTLFIYKGHSTNNTLITALTGNQNPGKIKTGTDKIKLHFKTDGSAKKDGWGFVFGSYESGVCWGDHLINYFAAGSAQNPVVYQLHDEYPNNPTSRLKLTEAGQAFTDWVDDNASPFAPDFPVRLDSIYVGVTHENNSNKNDTFEVYVKALGSNNFPDGPDLWNEEVITNQSLSPSGDYNSGQNVIRFLAFNPDIIVHDKFFVGVRYKGPIKDSASIIGLFENVGTQNNPRATDAFLGQAYRKHATSGSTQKWQPRPNGTEEDYVDWNQNGQFDKNNDEYPFFQQALIRTKVSEIIEEPAKPSINKNGDQLEVQGNYANYQWYRNGNELSGKTLSTLQLTSPGNYEVYVYGNYERCGTFSDPFKINRACKGTTTITADSGSVEDGSGNGDYGNFADCKWELTAPSGKPLRLKFTKFNLVQPEDSLYIYKGHSTNNEMITALTGNNNPGELNIESDKIMLHFRTDASETDKGWAFDFEVLDDQACNSTSTVNANSGSLEDGSGNADYGNFSECYWELTAPSGQPLNLAFTKFNLVSPGDSLYIYEGHSTNNTMIKALTGTANPDTINTGSDKIKVHFTSNGSGTDNGWAFDYYIKDTTSSFIRPSEANFQIFPNPSKGTFKMIFENPSDVSTYKVLSSKGKVLMESAQVKGISEEIDLSNKPDGIYFLEIRAKDDTYRKKLIKQ